MSVRIASLALCLCLCGPVAAQDEVDCTDWESGSQMVLNVCSYRDRQRADETLNRAWRAARVLARERDANAAPHHAEAPGVWQALLRGQRGWIAYRDGFCLAQRQLYRDGSIAPLIHHTCHADLTRKRTKELVDFATHP